MWQRQSASPEEIWFSLALHMLDKHYYPGKLLSGSVSVQIHLAGATSWLQWLHFKGAYECSLCFSFWHRCVAPCRNVISSLLQKLSLSSRSKSNNRPKSCALFFSFFAEANKCLHRSLMNSPKATTAFVLPCVCSNGPPQLACSMRSSPHIPLLCISPQQQKKHKIWST